MSDDLLNGEIYNSLKEAQVLIEMWRQHYNMVRPHSSLGYLPPMPATILIQSTQLQPIGYRKDWYNLWGQVNLYDPILCHVLLTSK
jgi:transposase InsO family protein